VILRDGIKTIQNVVFLFSLKKEQNLASFQKPKKTTFVSKKAKKTGGLFSKKRVFLNPGLNSSLAQRFPT